MKTKNRILSLVLAVGTVSLLGSCSSIPENAKAVENFDVASYMGTWYEIARLDFRYERDLDNVSAQYALNEKGHVSVLNSGHNFKKDEWEKAEGLAKFRGDKDVAKLKVSFFGPFYSGYNVVALDKDYQYALVAGKDLDYLWILSRSKDIPEGIKADYLQLAQEIGYDTSKLVWVKQDRNDNPFLVED